MGLRSNVARLQSSAQRKLKHFHRVHHFADLAYLCTAFVENHTAHTYAVGVLICVVASLLVIGEGEHA